MKLEAKDIAKAITDSMKGITEEIVKSIDKNKDSKDPVTVNLVIDEEKLAKSFESLNDNPCNKKKSAGDESVYVDEYDEMSDTELRSVAKSKGISVYSGTTSEMMKKKLRDYDEKHKNDNTTPESKLQDVVAKAMEELGIDKDKVKFEISTTKKSVVTPDDKPNADEDEDDEDGDGVTEKSLDKLSDEDKAEAIGLYLGGMVSKNMKNMKKKSKTSEEDDE